MMDGSILHKAGELDQKPCHFNRCITPRRPVLRDCEKDTPRVVAISTGGALDMKQSHEVRRAAVSPLRHY